MTELILFYDGHCPLCVSEMRRLTRNDQHQRLVLVDIHTPDFANYPHIDAQSASDILHGVTADGTLLLGLDAIHRAWQLVGKGGWYAPLRWRWLRPLADWAYLKFAANRYTLSRWLTGRARCQQGQCKKQL